MNEHSPQGERLARLEIQVQGIVADMAFLKGELRPITEAFQQAKGFKGAVYLFGILVLVAIGAGFKDAAGWIVSVVKP
jgi:hypothetical protein